MESKDISCKLLCMACLCVGRSLHEITDTKLRKYYLDALSEIPLNNMPSTCPLICWECEALLKRAMSFREQVKDSYRILQTYTNENLHECLLTDVTRPPRLNVTTNQAITISPGYLCSDKPDVQLVYIKDEVKNLWDEDIDLENASANVQECPVSEYSDNKAELESDIDTFVETIIRNKKRRNKAKKTKTEVDMLVKDENKDSEELTNLKQCPVSDCTDVAELETELETIVGTMMNDKKSRKVTSKVKRTKKIGERLRGVQHKKPIKKEDQKILTIELTYEEMLLERERESTRDSFLKAEYKCETCLVGFNYNKSYKTHVAAKHSPELGDYSCPICKTVISSVESFTAHYKRHMRRYECSMCHKRTMDAKVMQQHYFSTHEISLKEYKCNCCGKISNSIDAHRYHKDTHKARVQCSECDKTFRHRTGLMNHRLAVHEFHNAFPCTVCDKVFRWKTSLKRHLEKHDVKSNAAATAAICSLCGISFSSLCSYQRHMKNSLKHVTQDQLKFICNDCGRRFADKTKLRDHIEEKHLHKTYQCHICLKPSKNRVGLDQHIRNVHKGRPNNKMCHHCGKGFPTKVQLESHIRTHTGERPFICEYCPTTFSQQSNLYKHNGQVHLNIKSKRYPICKKRKDDDQTDTPTADTNQQPIGDPYRPVAVLHYSPERGFVI